MDNKYNEEFCEVLKRLTKEQKGELAMLIMDTMNSGKLKFPNDPDMNKAYSMLCPSRLGII